MRRIVVSLVLASISLFSMGYLHDEGLCEAAATEKVRVFGSILPASNFARKIGGEAIEVETLVGPGRDPHTFEPTPKTVAKLERSQVLFTVGFAFERVLAEKLSHGAGALRVVDLQKGVALRPMNGDHHAHGAADHGHGHAYDPHTWMDPLSAKIQARTIADTLRAIDPGRASLYAENLKRFEDELDGVHARLQVTLAPLKGSNFFVFHPAYGYFADRYGLHQTAVEIEGKEPTARQLAKLVKAARAQRVKFIFVQPQFSEKTAETLAAEIGAKIAVLDALPEDYLANFDKMAEQLQRAFSGAVN